MSNPLRRDDPASARAEMLRERYSAGRVPLNAPADDRRQQRAHWDATQAVEALEEGKTFQLMTIERIATNHRNDAATGEKLTSARAAIQHAANIQEAERVVTAFAADVRAHEASMPTRPARPVTTDAAKSETVTRFDDRQPEANRAREEMRADNYDAGRRPLRGRR